jgi:homoserine O-succinyltransferase
MCSCAQEIRELHIGLLNMMPDLALEATERQFFRLIGHSNQIAQFYLHPFTLSSIKRSEKTQAHIDQHYQSFDDIKAQGLDALIITGAHIEDADLEKAPFYAQLKEVIEWSYAGIIFNSPICNSRISWVLARSFDKIFSPSCRRRWKERKVECAMSGIS